MSILITGGAGYIGSHTAVELLNANYDIIILDNFSNSKEEALNRIKEITNKDFKFYQTDLLNYDDVSKIFEENQIESVIHFAGLKAVGESVSFPMKYYENNITGTLNLCKIMDKFNVKNLVFSSSATVYGEPKTVPITEDFHVGNVTNPYGRTKFMIENILNDLYIADNSWHIALLRYFNPIGAHKSGKIGEDPNGIPNNLLPFITQTAIGKREKLAVFGDDYDTPDGTGVRDYIHVVDLAIGHIKAIEKIVEKAGVYVYNLGTGNGYSVLEVVRAFEKASNMKVPYEIKERRAGDIPTCYADPKLAEKELGWVAKFDIETMCKDAWNWQKNNPDGFK